MQGMAASRDIMELLALAFEGGRVAEREACAKLCDELSNEVGNKNFIAIDQRQFCAKQIRLRGNHG